MKSFVTVAWESDMKFNASVDGHIVTMDSGKASGGHDLGPRPKSLLMVALAGCTGMDVISILKKMQVEVNSFNLRIESESSDEHPKKYLKMKVIYEFRGPEIDLEKVKKAVNLSIDKYCSVYATLKDSVEIEHEIEIIK